MLGCLLFRVGFVASGLDIFLHGAIDHQHGKYAGLALTVVAGLMNYHPLYMVALSFWLAVFLLEIARQEQESGKVVPAEIQVSTEGDQVPKGNNMPKPFVDKLVVCNDKFEANLQPDTNCEGKKWRVEKENDFIKIYSSESSTGYRFWKVETTVEVAGGKGQLFEELFNYDKRTGWDSMLKGGKSLKEFDGNHLGEHLVCTQYETHPVGPVSGREFCDIGFVKMDKTIKYVHQSVGDKDRSHLDVIPKSKKNPVRAFTHPGSGVLIEPCEDSSTRFKYTLVSCIDLNGWIPTSVINSSTTGAMVDSCKAMRKYLAKLPAPSAK